MSALDDLRRFTIADLKACPPGTGARVAVVDTGVDADVLGPSAALRSFAVATSGLLSTVERAPPGDIGHHGSSVASIVRALAPEAELHSVRLVDALGRGSAAALRTALEFCVRERYDVVNLSLGTRRRELLLDVYDLVDRAAMEGVVLVAATDDAGTPDYPAACAALLGVDRASAEDPYFLGFRGGHRVAFLARGVDVEVWARGGGRARVSGSSYACPHVAAFAARLKAARAGLHPFEIKTALSAAATPA